MCADCLISVQGLKKHFNHGQIKALDDVSIDIKKGAKKGTKKDMTMGM